jgi:LuxR family transcriptional regulator, regulator of acetate metabolism
MALINARPIDELTQALSRLGEATLRLRRCRDTGELLACSASLILEECGFSRGVILGVAERRLNAADSDALPDPASDRLRRLVLERPVAFTAGSLEEELITSAASGAPGHGGSPSALAARLGLGRYILEPILVQGNTVAMLVLDRDIPGVVAPERALAASYTAIVGILLEQQLLEARAADVASELRRLTTFSDALMNEALGGELLLPSFREQARPAAWMSANPDPSGVRADLLLTAQELRVARLLAAGRSNREIAAELVLSVDTIKSHVARILQKLGVANRAQAAVLIAGQ